METIGKHSLHTSYADPENFLRGVQVPRRDLKENFSMAKLIIWQFGGGGEGGGPDPPVPPLDPPMYSASFVFARRSRYL